MNKLNTTLYLFFLLLVILLTTKAALSPRIINGHAIPIATAPFQVRINNNNLVCGGFIIGPRYVLTAAHCFRYKNATFARNSHDMYKVKAGLTNLKNLKKRDIYGIEQVVVAPIIKDTDYDIAVVVVAREFKFSARIQPAKLPAREPIAGEDVLLTGWGRTERGSTNALMAVEATIGERGKCKDLLESPWFICTKSKKNGLGKCFGDSGGPAFTADGTVYGISSYMHANCDYTGNDYKGYGYWTNVYYFRDFIKKVTGL